LRKTNSNNKADLQTGGQFMSSLAAAAAAAASAAATRNPK